MEKKEYKEPSIKVVLLEHNKYLLADSSPSEDPEYDEELENENNIIKTLSDEIWTR